MPTIFENATDGFYSAFIEPDAEKRRASIDTWIKNASPEIQEAIEAELRACIESLLNETWTPEGWKKGAEKFIRPFNGKPLMDSFRLGLDIRLRQRVSADTVIGAPSAEVREKIIQKAKAILPEPKQAPMRKPRKPSAAEKADEYLFEVDGDSRGLNDDSQDYTDPESYLASRGNNKAFR